MLKGLRGTDIVLDYRAMNVQAKHVPFTDVSLELKLLPLNVANALVAPPAAILPWVEAKMSAWGVNGP
ncbi:hypothetical protein QLQ85_16970 [Halomonas sp. M4R5S39]|uniref:hypothetical protein n=1 Tax=Halomonas kalidii TaxID=3043293 RepID=UPI0024A89212|nr:hypothetical protein [Halomonas kalidii]MDI5986487.1 hypothetical protein [Halomonas kalidii]